jgi:hypothetical protein
MGKKVCDCGLTSHSLVCQLEVRVDSPDEGVPIRQSIFNRNTKSHRSHSLGRRCNVVDGVAVWLCLLLHISISQVFSIDNLVVMHDNDRYVCVPSDLAYFRDDGSQDLESFRDVLHVGGIDRRDLVSEKYLRENGGLIFCCPCY